MEAEVLSSQHNRQIVVSLQAIIQHDAQDRIPLSRGIRLTYLCSGSRMGTGEFTIIPLGEFIS